MTNDKYQILSVPGLQIPSTLADSKEIQRSFGHSEDFIELHIYSQNQELLYTEYNFTDYTLPTELTDRPSNEIAINPIQILKDRSFFTGQYVIKLNLFKEKIFSSYGAGQTGLKPFSIKEISTSRTELRAVTPNIQNATLDTAISSFISEIETSAYFQEITLNFGNDQLVRGVNILLNKNPETHEVFIKLANPLRSNINSSKNFSVVESIVEPIVIPIDLGTFQEIDSSTSLRGPNYQVDVRQQNSIPSSEYRTYDEILKYQLTSSYQHLLSRLEDKEIPDIQYDYIRPVSESFNGENLEETYHFENFVHFGSAYERLKNFEYKLKLIESYDRTISEIEQGSLNALSQSIFVGKAETEDKKLKILQGFDGYEKFLYYTTGSNPFVWPKQDSTSNTLYSVSSSEALTWLGNENSDNIYYGGQLLSASSFDRQNPYSLDKTIPLHILDNPDNGYYLGVLNMLGQHFDHIWTYIKHITEANDSRHVGGISKELVYHQLKSLGLETFDQFENSNLTEYILGEGTLGNKFYDTDHFYNYSLEHPSASGIINGVGLAVSASETLVTASNEGSIPKGDITKEIWKRIYHNAPYLVKTKGTERGLRALMACYGVPSTILNIKEYGGSVVDNDATRINPGYKTFRYEKSGLALKGITGANQYFVKTRWSSSLTDALNRSPKTVEFRIKPKRVTNEQFHLFNLSSSNTNLDPVLVLNPHTGNDVSASADRLDFGKIDLYLNNNVTASTPTFPIFNGDFWNVFIKADGNVSSTNPENDRHTITFGAYQSNFLGNVFTFSGSVDVSEVTRSVSFGMVSSSGNLLDGSTTGTEGGARYAYFGGMPTSGDSAYDSLHALKYSGSIQEIRYHFGEALNHDTLTKHALEPFMYSGNTMSSSYDNIVLRLPLGSNDKRDSGSYHPNIATTYLPYKSLAATATFPTSFNTGELMTLGTPSYITLTSAQGTSINYAPFAVEQIADSQYTQGEVSQNPIDDVSQTMFETGLSNNSSKFCSAVNGPNGHNGEINCVVNSDGSLTMTQTQTGTSGETNIVYNFPGGANAENLFYIIFFDTDPTNAPTNFAGGDDFIASSLPNPIWEEVVETHHLPTPDTVGSSMTSEKVRIDENSIDDHLNFLTHDGRLETSTLDRQPLDYEDLGVYFSPTTEINEDILYTLGSFRLDDYIGNPLPSAQSASFYKDLKTIKDLYFKKVERRYNFGDYIKTVQNIDHTLFKLIEQFVPAKANLKTGVLIEPHYLERHKIPRKGFPHRSDGQTMTPGLHQKFEFDLTLNDRVLDMRQSITGSMGGGQTRTKSGSSPDVEQIVTSNNFKFFGSSSAYLDSKGRRLVQGTNFTLDVLFNFKGDPDIAQAPIKPFGPKTSAPGGSATILHVSNSKYVKRESDVLLGNVMNARKSNKYYRNLGIGNINDIII